MEERINDKPRTELANFFIYLDNYSIIAMNLYYNDNGKKIGPILISDLKIDEIKPETLVWHKNIDNWTEAKNIPELDEYFNIVPPPLPEGAISTNKLADENIIDEQNSITDKRQSAVLGGIVLLAIYAIYYYYVKVSGSIIDEETFRNLSILYLIIRIIIPFWISNLAFRLKRNRWEWGILGFIFPSISLLILGTLGEKKDENIE